MQKLNEILLNVFLNTFKYKQIMISYKSKSYLKFLMKLLTKAILKKLPTIGSNEKNNKEHIAHVKLFGGSCWSWFISEFNPDTKECFGWVEGLENELGYFSLTELEELKFPPFGLPVERDICFESTPIKELMNK